MGDDVLNELKLIIRLELIDDKISDSVFFRLYYGNVFCIEYCIWATLTGFYLCMAVEVNKTNTMCLMCCFVTSSDAVPMAVARILCGVAVLENPEYHYPPLIIL